MSTPALLEIVDVSKRFGGVQALSNVSMRVERGQIYGLIGPNGAGKTTLFNVITGLYQPDQGRFTLAGMPYSPNAPHKVAKAGIARTFQNIRLFGEMTALENVMVGRHVRTHQGVLGAVCVIALLAMKKQRFGSVRQSCLNLSAYLIWHNVRRVPCLMATKDAWRLLVHWRPIRNCSL